MDLNTVMNSGRISDPRAVRASLAEGAARAGLAARGVIYLMVGGLALQIAFGDGHRQADRGGALAQLSATPFGAVLLWLLGAGLVGMALLRLSETVFGSVARTAAARANGCWHSPVRAGVGCGPRGYAVPAADRSPGS